MPRSRPADRRREMALRPAGPIPPPTPSERAGARPWPAERTRRLMWLGLAVALIGLPLLSLPGRYIADSHDVVWFAPGWYLRHSFTLWQQSPFLQGQSSLAVMAAVVGLLRSLGLSVWAAQRIWYGLLLFVAAAGMVLLVDHLRGRRSVAAPLTAALLYTLGPYTFGYGLLVSAQFPPYALLPLLLLVAGKGLSRRGLLWPALFGLTVFAMGGGNGAPQAFAMVPVLAYGLWVVLVERAVPPRTALAFAGWSAAFVAGPNAYWVISLSPEGVPNAVALRGQP